MIIITGATGQLGSQIVERLLDRVPADQVGVSVRDTDRATELAARGVRVRRGNYNEPDSLVNAFEGASQVLVISSNESGASAIDQHIAAIDAARAACAQRIVYTSHQASNADSLFSPMPDHAATERYLAESGPPFTSLRNGFYASTVRFLIGQALQTGEIVAPADGPVSWTTHADLAEAAAIILAAPGRFDGPTPPLTAPVAYDLESVAGLLTEITGRTVRRVVADDDEWLAGLISRGVPAHAADITMGIFRAARRGEFDVTGPTLESLLGHSSTPLRTVLETVAAP